MSESAKAVFLSYASQDAEAAKRICDALRTAGVEVWFDQSELVGGDAWDAKIRGLISSCALFLPVISASTQARREGYFRIEWRLAAQRTHAMADGTAFLLPIVIDGTKDAEALVPAEFKAVQWSRLPGGETPAAFGARVVKLIGGGEGAATIAPPEGGDRRPAAKSAPARRPLRLAPMILVLIAALGGLAVWQPWKNRAPPAATPAAPMSEARQLAERARTIMGKGDLTREQLDAAGELCERALQLDPSDAIAWSEAAHADLLFVHPYGYDRSEERRKRAQFRATRALSLAPDELEVRVMRAAVLAHAGSTPALLAEAAADFRELIASHPGDRRLVFQLAEVLREQLHFDEAARQFESIGEWELAGWSYYQAGKPLLALAAVERSLRERRAVTALQLKAILQCRVVQDLDAAQATLDQLRPSELLAEMVGATALDIALLRRDPARMLEILRGLTTDYFQSYAFTGPRQYFTGTAHSLAGRRSQAESEWRAGLALIQERLKAAPGDRHLLLWAAWFQATLGQKGEAQRLLDQAREADRQERAGGERYSDKVSTVVRFSDMVLLALGRSEEALAQLSELFRTRPPFWEDKHTSARFDPAYDPLRGDPRFEKLLRDNLPEGARSFDDPKPRAVAAPVVSDKSVAVLPFANLSGDKEQEYFSDGLTEEILMALMNERDLRVPGRASAFSFKGKSLAAPEIARALNVAQVVEGSVRRSGNQVRITVTLTRAVDGFSEPLGTFTERLDDIFALQEKVARAVVEKITKRTTTATGVAVQTKNPAAYDAYLRARARQLSVASSADAPETLRLFAEAARLDPGYALPWARIAQVQEGILSSGFDRSAEVRARAREAATTALRLGPDLPEAHRAMAMVQLSFEQDVEAAQRELNEAERLRPNDPENPWIQARIDFARGRRGEDLVRLVLQAAELDPQNATNLILMASLLNAIGRFADADRLLVQSLAASPNARAAALRAGNHLAWTGDLPGTLQMLDRFPENAVGGFMPFFTMRAQLRTGQGDFEAARKDCLRVRLDERRPTIGARGQRIRATWLLGRMELRRGHQAEAAALLAEALAEARQLVQEYPDESNAPPLLLALVQATLGQKAEALATADQGLRKARESRIAGVTSTAHRNRAEVLALLGEIEAAVADLRAAHETGTVFGYRLRREIEWEPLRGDPKFQQLMKEAEAQADAQPRPSGGPKAEDGGRK